MSTTITRLRLALLLVLALACAGGDGVPPEDPLERDSGSETKSTLGQEAPSDWNPGNRSSTTKPDSTAEQPEYVVPATPKVVTVKLPDLNLTSHTVVDVPFGPNGEHPAANPELRAAIAKAIQAAADAYNAVRVFPTEATYDYAHALAAGKAAHDIAPPDLTDLTDHAYGSSKQAEIVTELFDYDFNRFKMHPGISVDVARQRASDPYDGQEVDRIVGELMQESEALRSNLANSGESRRRAFLVAAETWRSLAEFARDPNIVHHDQAAATAEKAAGMKPGAFGRIDRVYGFFMRCTQKVSALVPVLEQKRCFDYGSAMLTYFDMNPDTGEAKEKWPEWKSDVRNRLELIGWMTDGEPLFEKLAF